MFEAVGAPFQDGYFDTCSRLLKADGAFLLQAIIINDRPYKAALRWVNFIKEYIFSGSYIPCLSSILKSTASQTDMRLFDVQDSTSDYVQTLMSWRERFVSQASALRDLGYTDMFQRLWIYYFCYCEGGFRQRSIGSVQILFCKPQSKIQNTPHRL